MTQQFKFGDMVRFTLTNPTETVEAIYLHEHVTDDSVAVLVTSKGFNINMPRVRLQLIPHPDTVRLDWLIENQAYVVHELPDADCAYFSVSFNTGVQTATGSTARQAIDAAVSMQAAEVV